MRQVVEDIVAFYRLFGSFEREQVCCGTVSAAQCIVLQTLLSGQWDVSALATHARVTKSAMTRLIDGLQARGWVARDKGPEDGRRVVVTLTKEGERQAKDLLRLTEKSIEMLLRHIPTGERNQVVRSIHLLREAAEQTRAGFDCC